MNYDTNRLKEAVDHLEEEIRNFSLANGGDIEITPKITLELQIQNKEQEYGYYQKKFREARMESEWNLFKLQQYLQMMDDG